MNEIVFWLVIVLVVIFVLSVIQHQITSEKADSETPISPRLSAEAKVENFTKMSLYKVNVAGISKRNPDRTYRQLIAAKLREGDPIRLARNPQNQYDANAIEIFTQDNEQIGFVPAERAEELAPQMDKGYRVEAWVHTVWPGTDSTNTGVLVAIQRYKPKKSS